MHVKVDNVIKAHPLCLEFSIELLPGWRPKNLQVCRRRELVRLPANLVVEKLGQDTMWDILLPPGAERRR
jgi:hypothetical protein